MPIALDAATVDALFEEMYAQEGYTLTVDLEAQTIAKPNGETIDFEVESFRKHCLLNGLDDIGLTLQDAEDISRFESQWKEKSPWLFGAIGAS